MDAPAPRQRPTAARWLRRARVDEQLLSRPIRLPHGRRDRLAPFPIGIAEPAVAMPVGVLRAIFLQEQRHAAPLKLPVHCRAVGQRSCRLLLERRCVNSPRSNSPSSVRHRPGHTDHGTPPQMLANRRSADPDGDCDLPFVHAKGRAAVSRLLESSASALSRRALLGRKEGWSAIRSSSSRASGRSQQDGQLRSEWVAVSVGIDGRIAPKSLGRVTSEGVKCFIKVKICSF